MSTPLYTADWHAGHDDALAGRPRALGGTRSGYRAGYDRGLTERLARTPDPCPDAFGQPKPGIVYWPEGAGLSR